MNAATTDGVLNADAGDDKTRMEDDEVTHIQPTRADAGFVTYSFSLDFQKDLRAVACYAPANWNIYLPINKHEPIAFYSTTGTTDGTCRWINSDARKQGGKYCVLQHLEDNGLTVLPEIPLATSSTHVTTEFTGLKPEYPVVFGSFVGGHTASNRDPGSNVNWISKETWDFFMRF